MMSCKPVKSSPIGWDAPWRAQTSAGQLSAIAFMTDFVARLGIASPLRSAMDAARAALK